MVKRMAGPMSGKGYGQPFPEAGTGAEMLRLILMARAKHYQERTAAGGGAYGRAQAEVAGMLSARTAYDAARAQLTEDWKPHPPPAYEVARLERQRDTARKAVATHAAAAQQAMLDWAAAVKAQAMTHRPQLTAAQRKDAEERLSRFRPEGWPPESVVAQRIRIAQAALETGDRALADVTLWNAGLDTVMAAAKLPQTDPFARHNQSAARTQDAVWGAERARLIAELCGPEAAADLDAWRDAETDAKQMVPLIHHEAGRMVEAEEW